MLRPLLLLLCSGCAWKLGPPKVHYADAEAALPLVRPSTDAQRWYVPVDAADAGEWLFFVDTGYSYSTCDDDFVAALEAKTGKRKSVRGELGNVTTAKAQLPDFALGGHQVQGLVCLVRDLGSTSSIRDPKEVRIAGVIGIDALRPFRVELDPAAGEIRLHDPATQDPLEPGPDTIPLRREGGFGTRVRVPVTVDGADARPLLDTGASHTYLHLDGIGLEPGWTEQDVWIEGTGPGGRQQMDRAYRSVDVFTIAGHTVPPLVITDRPRAPRTGGLLGLDVLDHFHIELDFERGLARLQPTQPLERPTWLDWRLDTPPVPIVIAPVPAD